MFETVLVANRGEIACRVVRTLARLGVRSVAVYSDADARARHVREADVAVRIGPAAARESYLSVERVLEAARATGAQAVHPGYGFLSESAAFARACEAAGVVLVGPSAAAMEVMGDKIRAKQAVSAAGVPVVPGRSEPGMTDDDLVAAAEEVGYPVLVKPSAGGGGKGMRLVTEPGALREALRSARREAAASFGDDTLFLERYVLRPRHVEVQVLADAHGTTLYLGERECSLQRRHQKVVEEAPSVLLDAAGRERLGALAVETARSVAYTGVGTVEFIVSDAAPDEPFFMEMNTRLQVEHPVTELVTGLDLVEQQLLVASGERLAIGQADVRLTGHAVEARVYAEDPASGFLPTGGHALLVREPSGEGTRVDSALVEGEDVGTTYDPMIGKVVAWGPDRTAALARLDRALGQSVVLGVRTNTAFLRSLLRHPDVQAGRLDTGLLERELDHLVDAAVPERAHVAAAMARLRAAPADATPWGAADGWRQSGTRAAWTWRVAGPDGDPLLVTALGDARAAVVTVGGGVPVQARTSPLPDGFLLDCGGTAGQVLIARDGATTWVWLDGATWSVEELPPPRRGADTAGAGGEVRSPMPGTVIAVQVARGDIVGKGDVLLVVEAMKMEHALVAPVDGEVSGLEAGVGDQVAVGQLLVTVTP